jgi:hypothetical protein
MHTYRHPFSLPPARVLIAAAVLLLGGLAAGLTWTPHAADAAVSAPETMETRVSARCPECGVVMTTRALASGAGARHEVTVRMSSGASRVFTDANPANWRPGQRVILIEAVN